MERKIDIVIITGYLGAGKTTLLNRLVESSGNGNIGILVNDFGKVPVDGRLVRSSRQDLENNRIYEIGNGSIFCSCLTSSFVFGLRYFMRQKPDLLYIETSGMSDPASMARLLGEYQLAGAFRIRHVLAVVDSTNVLKMRRNFSFVDRQIAASNTVLLNKADLIEEGGREELEDMVRAINGSARMEWTRFCGFDYSALKDEPFIPDGEAQSCNSPETAPGTMFLPQRQFRKVGFIGYLEDLVGKTMRLKGFYEVEGELLYLSNNNGSLDMRRAEGESSSEKGITLIYEKAHEEAIRDSWLSFCEENEI